MLSFFEKQVFFLVHLLALMSYSIFHKDNATVPGKDNQCFRFCPVTSKLEIHCTRETVFLEYFAALVLLV